MTRHPAAYVRKSTRKTEESAAAQLAAIQTIAAADGTTIADHAVYSDIGLSGRFGKRGAGSDWQRLQEEIEADRVSTLYLTVTDRAGRSIEEWARFARILREHKVRLVSQYGDVDLSPGLSRATIDMLIAEAEGEKAVERARRGEVTKDRRGDAKGVAPYGQMIVREAGTGRVIRVPNPAEDVSAVIAAVRETGGNVLAATRILNARDVRARRANWSPKSVAKIVRREEPRLLRQASPRTTNGELRAPAPLAKIVRCHCGTVMTPRRGGTQMYCYAGIKLGKAHGRYVASSLPVYAMIRAETEGKREVKGRTIYTSDVTGRAEQKAALEEELRRLGKAYRAGAVDDEEFESETTRIRSDLDSIEDDIADLDAAVSLTLTAHGPVIHWDKLESDPAHVGDELRQLVREVRLDANMKPVSVEWRRAIEPFTPKRIRPRR
jgi:DNA invertase Pin-like site-specific DNA recombinase